MCLVSKYSPRNFFLRESLTVFLFYIGSQIIFREYTKLHEHLVTNFRNVFSPITIYDIRMCLGTESISIVRPRSCMLLVGCRRTLYIFRCYIESNGIVKLSQIVGRKTFEKNIIVWCSSVVVQLGIRLETPRKLWKVVIRFGLFPAQI
jgi:hypothetical protein